MNLTKLVPAKVGAEPKKMAVLAVLLVGAVGAYLFNRSPSGGPDTPAAAVPAEPAAARTPALIPSAPRPAARTESVNARNGNIADFKPTLKLAEGMDVSRIDPALRVDLLAKLRDVPVAGGSNSLFEFSQPPPPPPPPVKPIVPGTGAAAAPPPSPPAAEGPKGPVEPAKPATPPPPPITLKFYGYAGTARSGARRAFFLDGDDILVAGENDVVKNRYKVVRIGVNSAVVEDTSSKSQQTLPLVEEL